MDATSPSTQVLVIRWPDTGWTDVVASIDELRIITGANLHGNPTEAAEVANAEEVARIWGMWMAAREAWEQKPDGEDTAWTPQAIVRLIRELRELGYEDKIIEFTAQYQEHRPEMWAVVVDLLEGL